MSKSFSDDERDLAARFFDLLCEDRGIELKKREELLFLFSRVFLLSGNKGRMVAALEAENAILKGQVTLLTRMGHKESLPR